MEHWISLINRRGLAGPGAREKPEEKEIVERSIANEFMETLRINYQINFENLTQVEPPHPDFSVFINNEKISIELVEFMGPKIIKQLKYIIDNSESKINEIKLENSKKYLDRVWFERVLKAAIKNKIDIYLRKGLRVDILLIWNEIMELSVDSINSFINEIKLDQLSHIESIYFMNWYDPSFSARPTWSIISHKHIGSVEPIQKQDI